MYFIAGMYIAWFDIVINFLLRKRGVNEPNDECMYERERERDGSYITE